MKKTGKKNVWTQTPVVVLTAAFCCILWASAAPCIKIGYKLFGVATDDVPSILLFAGLRFTIAGLMVIAAGSVLQHRLLLPRKSSWKGILTLAALQTVIQYIFFYNGVAHTSGVRTSIINACGTFFSIAVSVLIFRFEKLTIAKVIGSIAGFLGVLVIVTNGNAISGTPFTLAGEGLVIISTLSSAFAGCAIKLFSRHEDPVLLSGWQFFFGGLIMMALGAAGGGRLVPNAATCIPLILYMGFISAGAYTFWGILLKYNEVSKVTICGFMNPVFGVIISAILLGEFSEAANLYTLIALLLVVAGIVIVNRPPKAAG